MEPIVDPVTINGYSQPGSQANTAVSPLPFNGTLLIQLDGNGYANSNGLTLDDGADGSIISGLVISSFEGSGLYMVGTGISNVTIAGNYIGTSTDGQNGLGSIDAGISVISSTATNITIGGPAASARNIISGQVNGSGIGTSQNITGTLLVQGNYIGMAADGLTDIGNGSGVTSNVSTEVANNLISGNSALNISLSGSNNQTIGNLIGTNRLGQIDTSIVQGMGISINQTASGSIIGGLNRSDANIIAGNTIGGIMAAGVSIPSIPLLLTPNKNAILGNSIFGNLDGNYQGLGTAPGLGIDSLIAEVDGSFTPTSNVGIGPTLNDILDPDTGPNNYMNFPVLNSVAQDGDDAVINYSIDAADSPVNQYRVEFFGNDEADPLGYGEGQTFLGAVTSNNGDNQQTSFTLPAGYDVAGKSISATTTAVDDTTDSGFGSTSEFSKILHVADEASNSSKLASTGQSVALAILLASTSTAVGAWALLRKLQS